MGMVTAHRVVAIHARWRNKVFRTTPVATADALPQRYLGASKAMALITCYHWFGERPWVKIHGQVQVAVAASLPLQEGDGLTIRYPSVVLTSFEAVPGIGPVVRALLATLLKDPTTLLSTSQLQRQLQRLRGRFSKPVSKARCFFWHRLPLIFSKALSGRLSLIWIGLHSVCKPRRQVSTWFHEGGTQVLVLCLNDKSCSHEDKRVIAFTPSLESPMLVSLAWRKRLLSELLPVNLAETPERNCRFSRQKSLPSVGVEEVSFSRRAWSVVVGEHRLNGIWVQKRRATPRGEHA
eukprot:6491630-Amphidinium_carterae.2